MVARLLPLVLVLAAILGGGGPLPVAQAQIEELPRPDSAHAGSFGVSVALGDSLAVVGASGEATCGDNAGAVYVFERVPRPQFDVWRGTTRLTPRSCQPSAFFGEQVALSGNRLLVSAFSEHVADEDSNVVYVFERRPETGWAQTARLTGHPDRDEGLFGADLDLDGTRAVVSTTGAPDEQRDGAAYVFDYDPTAETWQTSARLTAERGAEAPGVLGQSVALDGNRLAVAASTYFERAPGAIYLFRRAPETGTWINTDRIRGPASFFVDLDLDHSHLLVGEERAGENNTGRATLYATGPGSSWAKTATLRPSIPYESGSFGTTVSLDGDLALVTGYDEQLNQDVNIDRVVYVFRRSEDGTWAEHTLLDIGEVDFGAALDQNGSLALISSVPSEGAGTAYVVQLK